MRAGDSGAALALIDRLYNASKDMERLCAEWTEYFRNLMILKSVKDAADLIVAPPAELHRMAAEAEQFELPAILHCMNVLQQALERLRGGVSRRVEMEMAVLPPMLPRFGRQRGQPAASGQDAGGYDQIGYDAGAAGAGGSVSSGGPGGRRRARGPAAPQ